MIGIRIQKNDLSFWKIWIIFYLIEFQTQEIVITVDSGMEIGDVEALETVVEVDSVAVGALVPVQTVVGDLEMVDGADPTKTMYAITWSAELMELSALKSKDDHDTIAIVHVQFYIII